ncbi:NAD(P)/FAD-dependent oxidoreductase [Clostridium sp. BJN0001]|uniref:NAD(P)/FAD-dependent oxidoreductase n=1 Tax=Clostridium sp. BJN0001 TaxID=2930219 RepID=UPI001FD22560|nr:NAD(P)/FAD-dependent oxidoreductase [Clostridium sp. BJN0001]
MFFHDLIILGGGASGLTAAICAKDLGMDVAIIESNDRIGKKILSTGNGRCNISNSKIESPYINYHSSNKNFYKEILDNFSVSDTKNFFMSLGLPFTELSDGKMYPSSLQASSVVDILKLALDEREIPVYTSCKVKDVSKNKNFVLVTSNDEYKKFTCNKLILACGGKSAPNSGSDGSGFKIAKMLGHSIVEPLPGIVQLKLDYPHLRALSGIKFNGNASLFIDKTLKRTCFGEILFTDYGISGPPILQLSSDVSKFLSKGHKVYINIDMFPEKTLDSLTDLLMSHFSVFSYREISSSLIGIINKKLIPIILKDTGIANIHETCDMIDWNLINDLIKKFKSWNFICTGTKGFTNAQVTVGGVNTNEIDKYTLESLKCKNLLFSGEIMDVNGDCGGFNLQWAWSSGYIVAKSAYNLK